MGRPLNTKREAATYLSAIISGSPDVNVGQVCVLWRGREFRGLVGGRMSGPRQGRVSAGQEQFCNGLRGSGVVA